MGSSASQRHSVVVEIWVTTPQATSSSRSSARLQRLTGTPRVAGSSQATASAVVTTAAGNTRGTARPLAIGQAREPLLAEAFAPFGHGVDRDPKPPGDHLVGQARRGLEHDPSPHHLSVLGGLLAHQRFEVAALSRAQRDHQRAAPAASLLVRAARSGRSETMWSAIANGTATVGTRASGSRASGPVEGVTSRGR